jgi:hypothetical protein
MKRNTLFLGVVALAMLGGLALSGCDTLEDGTGTIKLTNNSTNVLVVYWSLEDFGKTIWQSQVTLSPGQSVSHDMDSAIGISVYLEDNGGIGWISKKSYTVEKDKTVVVKFPSDFNVD